ncbi:MAG: Crp/Fnr family transcriptional regulator [Candidatus Saccharimonadia bacterium]
MQANTLSELFSSGHKKTFSKNEIILRAGEVPEGVYQIVSGMVKVYSITDEGEENIHIIYKPLEVFPFIWAFKGVVRDIFYEAMESVTVQIISRTKFLDSAKHDPNFSFQIAEQIAEQFFIYADRLDNLEYTTAYARIVYRILFLAHRFGHQSGKKIIIHAPITHHAIASSVNVARETASREIELLVKKGLITQTNKEITIPDIEKLAAEIGSNVNLETWNMGN